MLEADVPLQPQKRELQAFLRIVNYLSKFSPSTAEVCHSLSHLTSVKAESTWNASYQRLFDNVKLTIKEDAYMRFYDETKQLYLETGGSGVGFRPALL